MRKPHITGTFVPTDRVVCKQCISGSRPLIIRVLGSQPKLHGNEHVVRFMGQWVCKIHYKIKVKGQYATVTLGDLFPNRQIRREAMKRRRMTPTVI